MYTTVDSVTMMQVQELLPGVVTFAETFWKWQILVWLVLALVPVALFWAFATEKISFGGFIISEVFCYLILSLLNGVSLTSDFILHGKEHTVGQTFLGGLIWFFTVPIIIAIIAFVSWVRKCGRESSSRSGYSGSSGRLFRSSVSYPTPAENWTIASQSGNTVTWRSDGGDTKTTSIPPGLYSQRNVTLHGNSYSVRDGSRTNTYDHNGKIIGTIFDSMK